jgi:hypothetical protein
MGLFAVDPIEKGTNLGTLFWDQDGSLDPIFVKATTDHRRKLAGQWLWGGPPTRPRGEGVGQEELINKYITEHFDEADPDIKGLDGTPSLGPNSWGPSCLRSNRSLWCATFGSGVWDLMTDYCTIS